MFILGVKALRRFRTRSYCTDRSNEAKDKKERMKKYRLLNEGTIKEQKKMYRLKNKEKINEQKKQYRINNLSVIHERERQYRIKNRDIIKKNLKQYYLNNTDVIKEQKKQYYLYHKEAIQQHKKQHYLKNKETIKELNKQKYDEKHPHKPKKLKKGLKYYLENREHIRQQKKQYHIENKHSVQVRMKQYYVKKRAHVTPKNKSWTRGKVIEFLTFVQKQFQISTTSDWYRVSRYQIVTLGGTRLLGKFGSLYGALQFAFPETDWDESKFTIRSKKSTQRWLRVILSQILPVDTEIIEDFMHPDLLWENDLGCDKMELDVWVPKYRLALEYQGEHHYFDNIQAFGTSDDYIERDAKKRAVCRKQGITLAIIPFWWGGNKDSLAATLHQLLPDVFPKISHLPIPDHPPEIISDSEKKADPKILATLMQEREWQKSEHDPSGWFMSERLDGIRAFWDGSRFFSKSGKLLSVPWEFSRTLPSDVPLDGELWSRDNKCKLNTLLKASPVEKQLLTKDWTQVKFCVFDAPLHPGKSFLSRYSFVRDCISGCAPNISIIPIEQCLDSEHLQFKLQIISKKGGEGVRLYRPESKYKSTKNNVLLNLKALREDTVKLLKLNPNSYSFICEQLNGLISAIKCNGWEYMNSPPIGTVLAVKHSGYHKKSQKMKYPHFIRGRPDLSWTELRSEINTHT